MSFTNSTTNYGLPQYISTDIPSYLVDQNGAWATIDSALKSASDDATQAINDASTADGKAVTAQTDASSALTKANGALSNIADTFDSTATYSVGDRVIYNAILYVCSTAVTIPGAFDPVNWTRETIEEEIDNIKSDISTINSNLTKSNFIKNFDTLNQYEDIDIRNYTKLSCFLMYNATTCLDTKEVDIKAVMYAIDTFGSPFSITLEHYQTSSVYVTSRFAFTKVDANTIRMTLDNRGQGTWGNHGVYVFGTL